MTNSSFGRPRRFPLASPTGRAPRAPALQELPIPPSHAGVSQLKELLDALRNPQPLVPTTGDLAVDYAGLEARLAGHITGKDSPWAPKPAAPRERADLFSTYIPDPSVVLRDTEARPEHYEPEELETIRRVMAKEPTTVHERSLLLMRYVRASSPKPRVPEPPKKAADPEDETVLEDPEIPVFEDNRKVITII